MAGRTFDVKCGDLAELFLWDADHVDTTPDKIASLALYIQESIEDWFAENAPRPIEEIADGRDFTAPYEP